MTLPSGTITHEYLRQPQLAANLYHGKKAQKGFQSL